MSTSFLDSRFGDVEQSIINKIRVSLGVSGLLALVVGIVILVWPVKTAMVVAGIIAVYAAIAGLINLSIAIFARNAGAWPREGYGALGAAFLVAAVIAFSNLEGAASMLAILIGILVGAVWIIEGVVGLTMISNAPSKVWAIVYAIISVIAGIVVITSPIWGATLLWLFLGVSLVVLGVIQLIRAFRFGPR